MSPGRYLFALLKGTPDPFLVFFPGEAPVEVAGRFKTLRAARAVPPKLYPLMVTFGNLADPTSVRRVDPADLAASFGPGIRLKSITLEITAEPVTEGRVEKVLGWLTWSREKLLSIGGGRNPVRVPDNGGLLALDAPDFRRK